MMPEPKRCNWAGSDPLYQHYHDTEWGVPVHADQTHFEFLCLEGAQAGLSWITILKKREHYRQVCAQFDPRKVARFTEKKIESLLEDPGIIRNRLKVESMVSNAKAFLKLQAEHGSFDAYIWAFVAGKPIVNHPKTMRGVPAVTPLAEKISKDLKRRGFRFVGPTIIYSYLQACGLVNDHLEDCDFKYPSATRR